jgi:transposase
LLYSIKMDRNERLPRNLSAEECAVVVVVVVVSFSEEGGSQLFIARRLGVTKSTILSVQNRFTETGDNTRRLNQCRKRITNAAQDGDTVCSKKFWSSRL